MTTGEDNLFHPTGDWTKVLFEAIDDAVFVHDLEGNILEANPAACRRLGYDRDEFLRMTTRDIDEPEFASGFADRLHKQLQNQTMRFEGRHRTKTGEVVPVDINTSTVLLRGQPAVLAVMRDITSRKEAEDALARQTQLLQSILNNMGEAVIVTDQERRILVYNPAAQRMLGFTPLEESVGRVLLPRAVFLPDRITPIPDVDLPLRRCIRGEEVDDLEMFARWHENSPGMSISATGRPLRDEQGQIKGAVLVYRDITEKRRSQRHQEAQYAVAQTLASANSLEEVSQQILKILCEALMVEMGALWLVQAGDNLLQCKNYWQTPALNTPEFLTMTRRIAFPPGYGLPGRVLVQGEAIFLDTAQANRSLFPRAPVAAREGLGGALGFPIKSGGETIGVLEFFTTQAQSTDPALVSMMRALGSQIGQFLARHRVEKALRDSEALYHSLVESIPQNLFRKDRTGHITFGNQRYCQTLKRSLQDLLGKTDFDLFPPELAAKYVQDDQQVMATGKIFDTVEAHQLVDGSTIYVQVVKTPTYDAQGKIIGTQAIFWDVTAQKRAVDALENSERRYRQLTEATLDGIILVDQKGAIKLFNPAAGRMFGYRAEEVLGKPVTVLFPPRFHDSYMQDLQQLGELGPVPGIGKTLELQAVRNEGGEFPVEIAFSVLTMGGPPGPNGREPLQFLGAMRDLTERNKIRTILVQNEKMASIGMLSAMVAHEINNPLAFVGNNLVVLERDCKGLLNLLEHFVGLQDQLAQINPAAVDRAKAMAEEIDLQYICENLPRLLNRTRDGVDRVTRIIHSLRGLARTDAPKSQETNLSDLVDYCVEVLRGRLKKHAIQVEQDHDPAPRVSCVTTQIDQVILNLLVNAVQAIEQRMDDPRKKVEHGPGGKDRAIPGAGAAEPGRILIRTRRCPAPNAGDGEGLEEMMLEITDNGCGIEPGHRDRLFDPFFTTKEVGEGTGLGLSISHNIVTAHGGRIEVQSQPGQGATFRIFLPLQNPKNPVSPPFPRAGVSS